MSLCSRIVSTAIAELGALERPTNRTKYGVAYGWDGVPWCGVFVWWVFRECGVDLRELGISSPASTNAIDAEATEVDGTRMRIVPACDARPGDIVVFDFGDLGVGDVAGDADHVGVCVASGPPGCVTCVEGNTSSGSSGSQANGDGVFRRVRPVHVVKHVFRPPWNEWEGDDVTPEDIEAIAKAVHKLQDIDSGDPQNKLWSLCGALRWLVAKARRDSAELAKAREDIAEIKALLKARP